MVHGCLLGTKALLLLEFLVEAEHGALLGGVHVACAATTGGEVRCGWRRNQLGARCWARGCWAVGEVVGLDAGNVASAATTGVDVGAAYGWVRLRDMEGNHFGIGYLCCVGVVGS